MELKEKSIQELENDFWPDSIEYPTGLVERCHRYRKIKLKDLQIRQIITLLIQDIGSEYLMPLVFERMNKDISEEDNINGSSFLESLEFFSDEIFRRNPELRTTALELLKRKQNEIVDIIGWKQYGKLEDKIKK
jgi:hypothetical protein